jgi:hypothetical protein
MLCGEAMRLEASDVADGDQPEALRRWERSMTRMSGELASLSVLYQGIAPLAGPGQSLSEMMMLYIHFPPFGSEARRSMGQV